MNEYIVYCQWDSCKGSAFVETQVAYIMAYSKSDAENRARAHYGHHEGFKILDVEES